MHSERFTWAAETLDLQGQETILEVGSGSGLFAEVLLRRLTTGRLVTIDSSKPLNAKSHKRNKMAVDAGRLQMHSCKLQEFEGLGKYDIIVSFNLNLFYKEGIKTALAPLAKLLKNEGMLYVFYQGPGLLKEEVPKNIMLQVDATCFRYIRTLLNYDIWPPVLCVQFAGK